MNDSIIIAVLLGALGGFGMMAAALLVAVL